MRNLRAFGISVLGLAVLHGVTFAQSQTITGRLIDLACYWQDKANKGKAHTEGRMNCAAACAREGFQVGVLTENGDVYRIIGGLTADKNAKLWPHMSQTVTITGDVGEQEGNKIISANELTAAKL
jgi:hypothetical protein